MFDTRKEKLLFYFALLLLLAVYFAGMFVDVTRDAAKYAYIAKEILQTGNWFSLHIQGEPYLQKPQLLFWLEAISFKVFGVSNAVFRLPIIIYSIIGYYAVYRLGRSLYSKNTGIIAASIVAFSIIGVLYNSDIHTDVVLQTNVSLATWMLWGFLNKHSLKYLIGSGVALGLCILTKGPFGVLVPFFAVAGYLISTHRIKEIFSMKWLFILIIVLVVSSPAMIVQYIENGWDGLWFFFWQNNVGRVTGSYMGSKIDPIFYIHNLLYLFLPWTVFLLSGAYVQIKSFFRRRISPPDLFVFWGIWVFFLLLSVSMSKLPNYIQSVIPLLALTTANFWEKSFSGEHSKQWGKAQYVLIVASWVLILTVLILIIKPSSLYIVPTLLFLFIVVFIVIGKSEQAFFLRSIYTLLALGTLLNAHVLQEMFGFQAQPKAARIINKEIAPNEKVYNYDVAALERKRLINSKEKPDSLSDFENTPNEKHFFLNYELMFYCNEPIIHIENANQRNLALNNAGAWIFTDEKGKKELLEIHSNYDKILKLEHFNLRRSARFINPKTRRAAFDKMYLMHVSE